MKVITDGKFGVVHTDISKITLPDGRHIELRDNGEIMLCSGVLSMKRVAVITSRTYTVATIEPYLGEPYLMITDKLSAHIGGTIGVTVHGSFIDYDKAKSVAEAAAIKIGTTVLEDISTETL